jgi:SHS2 domain-containing protein
LIEAQIFGAPVSGFKKDIKAVSYHQNAIKNKDGFLEATLVLDI